MKAKRWKRLSLSESPFGDADLVEIEDTPPPAVVEVTMVAEGVGSLPSWDPVLPLFRGGDAVT